MCTSRHVTSRRAADGRTAFPIRAACSPRRRFITHSISQTDIDHSKIIDAPFTPGALRRWTSSVDVALLHKWVLCPYTGQWLLYPCARQWAPWPCTRKSLDAAWRGRGVSSDDLANIDLQERGKVHMFCARFFVRCGWVRTN